MAEPPRRRRRRSTSVASLVSGILKFLPEGVVRVGGQSVNEKLTKYLLTNVRRSRFYGHQPQAVQMAMNDLYQERNEHQKSLHLVDYECNQTKRQLLKPSVLKAFISDDHSRQLGISSKEPFDLASQKLKTWLFDDLQLPELHGQRSDEIEDFDAEDRVMANVSVNNKGDDGFSETYIKQVHISFY